MFDVRYTILRSVQDNNDCDNMDVKFNGTSNNCFIILRTWVELKKRLIRSSPTPLPHNNTPPQQQQQHKTTQRHTTAHQTHTHTHTTRHSQQRTTTHNNTQQLTTTYNNNNNNITKQHNSTPDTHHTTRHSQQQNPRFSQCALRKCPETLEVGAMIDDVVCGNLVPLPIL